MEEKAEALRFLIKRFLIAVPFFALGTLLMLEITLLSIFGLVFFVFGGFLIAKPVSHLLGVSAGSLIFPSGDGNRVHLVFSIPESRIMEGKYQEALELFQAMIPEAPGRLEVYMRIMKLAVKKMKQPGIAKETLHTGLENLKQLDDRKRLAAEYRSLMIYYRDEREKLDQG